MNKLPKSILLAAIIFSSLQVSSANPNAAMESDRVLVGAYDDSNPNGIILIANERNFFGLRILIYRPGVAVEEIPRSIDFGEIANDGSYAKLSWRSRFDDKAPVVLEWTRAGDRAVVGHLTSAPNTRVAIEVYRPWSNVRTDASWTAFSAQKDRRTILGEQVHSGKEKPRLRHLLLRTSHAASGAADYSDPLLMRRTMVREGGVQQSRPKQESHEVSGFAALSFDPASISPAVSIGFIAMLGDDFNLMDARADALLQTPVADLIDKSAKNHYATRPSSNGALGNVIDWMGRHAGWSRSYLPEKNLEYQSFARQPLHSAQITASSWNWFFNGAMASVFDGPGSISSLRLLLGTQTIDGRVALRRYLQNAPGDEAAIATGRSMPPIGALCVWKTYLVTNDLAFLAWAYPKLRQWNDWWFTNRGDGQAWRDGNGDGLLEWGFDAELEQGQIGAITLSNAAKQKMAFSESGLDDRPQWLGNQQVMAYAGNSGRQIAEDEAKYNEKTRTLEYSTVALNSMYALDTEIMMLMARELALPLDSDKLGIRLEQLRKIINEKLWSEEDGMYLNRHWDGRFSRRLSPENFYPLLAGLADENRANRMIKTLRNPDKFWGDHLLPSVARDDPAFTGRSPGRGAIWAPMNYLVYLGLKRYGFSDEAAELARKSLAITRAAVEKNGLFHDEFSSLDGKPLRGARDERSAERPETVNDAHQASFFGLMAWPAVEELLSADPWAGLSIGSLAAVEESRIERAGFAGTKFDVIAGPKRTVVRRDGRIDIECESPVRFRAYRSHDRAIAFAIETRERTHILVPGAEGRKITVSVDDKVLGSTSAGSAASFKVSSGIHKVLIVR